ncbi:MAG: 16S rRNA (guanine(527)-N(7))-methyltransferase RsmG [Oscillospiraceae bacterium]|nr:16S rRNA (guanine(527)-N(7))-methyltransferase RsmG [Oscillospiraceae bacterium]
MEFIQENSALLQKLTEFMLCYNKKLNLTRIVEPREVVEKHYIDSILPLTLYNVPRGTYVLDVGSGAGFPGIPMKIFRGDLTVTLLDSSRKRTDYLRLLLEEIGVDCEVVTARSEELAHDLQFREEYGVVVARAVANLPSLCEYCLPFVARGGVFLAMKGENDESDSADFAIEQLGGELDGVIKYNLPSGDKRSLVVVRKSGGCPGRYPRKRVNIGKNPLVK